MIGHFGNNAIEMAKRKSKPKQKNIEKLNKYVKQIFTNQKITNNGFWNNL